MISSNDLCILMFNLLVCACASSYSNCQTKLWDVISGETCIFQPSSTALIIDESEEEGTISNEVLHVATCDKVTAASYTHGGLNLLIYSLEV